MRAQGALEYLIIIAAVLGISAVVVLFVTGAFTGSSSGADLSKCRLAAANCQKDMAMGLSSTCPYCDTACADSSGKDLISKTPGCGDACQQCKQGSTISAGEGPSYGLIGYWNFDEGRGVIISDGSGNGNTGTYVGETFNDGTTTGVPDWIDGKYGKALRFDGLNDYVEIPNSPTLNPVTTLTISAWVNITSFAAHSPIVDKYIYLGGGYILVISSSQRLAFRADNGAATQEIIAPYTYLNSWHHIAATFNSTHVKLYIDGNEVASQSNNLGTILANSYNVRTGFTTSGYYRAYANAVIDSVRIFSKSLNQSEIQDEMGSPLSVLRAVGTWEFNEGLDTVARDTHIWVQGKSGTALAFDGIDDYIDVADSASLDITSNISVSAWVKYTSYNGGAQPYSVIIVKGPPWNFLLENLNKKVRFRLTVGGVDVNAQDPQPHELNKWYHFIGVYNGSNILIYRDSTLVANTPRTGELGVNDVTAKIGTYQGATYNLNGTIDNIRIYNRALNEDDVKYLYEHLS